jgi:SH3-like domain-containing protein
VKKNIFFFVRVLTTVFFFSSAVHAGSENDGGDSTAKTGLPLPRFAALRSNEVNMRTGPGTRYPIEWVFTRQGLPVEIIGEYEIWRRVRDPEGTEGWVHKTSLTGKRGLIMSGKGHDLMSDKDEHSEPLAHLQIGAIGQLISCEKIWCKAKFESVKGWVRKADFWGAYPTETFD